MTAAESEMRLIVARTAQIEAQRQTAEERGDYPAVRDYEVELSRLWSRYVDLEHQVA
jgi:hypothetical protein